MGLCASKSSTLNASTSSGTHSSYDSEGSSRATTAPVVESNSLPQSPQLSALRVALGTRPERLRTGGDAPLEQHQIQQAAYHMGAYVVGDEVTSPTRLATAGQTVHDVRLLLKHGRGNVKADDIPSHSHNGIGSSVARMAPHETVNVATAVVMGAALCDQSAPLSAIVHAPHMATDELSETVVAYVPMKQVTNEGHEIPVQAGHTWNELRRGGRDPSSTVVMDAWANGPAVRLKDSAWSGATLQKNPWSMDKGGAESLKESLEQWIPLLHPDRSQSTAANLSEKQKEPTSWIKYEEPQVISPEFASRVREVLSRWPEEQRRKIASQMIQETYGMDTDASTHQSAVESVLAAAAQLDALPRPPVVPPEH